jgi:hypothetical protein
MTRLPCELASPATMSRKRRQLTCVVAGCSNPAGKHKNKCSKCHDRAWRERYPEHHLWNNLKKSAKRRGLDFTITKGWFVSWCEMTGFHEMVGRTKGSASIDRIESWRGYHVDNIQILEVGANSAKGQRPPPINSEQFSDDHPF